jgi:hypothetical protein
MAEPSAHDEPGEFAAVPGRLPQQQRAGFRFPPDMTGWSSNGNLNTPLLNFDGGMRIAKRYILTRAFSLYTVRMRGALSSLWQKSSFERGTTSQAAEKLECREGYGLQPVR